MIVYEREHDFVLTAQHEHGQVAGVMASHWKDELLADSRHREELILAAREHDRGWIELDSAPFGMITANPLIRFGISRYVLVLYFTKRN